MRVLKVGDRLFRLNIGNNARHRPQVLTPVLVTKCGRKYFTVVNDGVDYPIESRHELDGWQQECGGYSACYALYESEQAWADEREHADLTAKIRDAFRYGATPVPLNVLKAIAALLWPNPQDAQTQVAP